MDAPQPPENIPIWDLRRRNLASVPDMGGSLHTRAYEEFRRRLRRAREAAGLTQTQVARALGLSQSFVSKCESGERRVDVLELARLAALYGKPLAFFVPSAL